MTRNLAPSRARGLVRNALLLLTVMIALSGAGISRAAEQPVDAIAFIQENFDRSFAALNNPALNAADRHQRFHDAVLNLIDVRSTASYTLGASAALASQGDMETFVNAFREYTVASYEDELSDGATLSIKVTDLRPCEAGDVLVDAVLARPNGHTSTITFRVRKQAQGRLAIVDVRVSGIWMSVVKQAEFATFLYLNGGSVAKLSAHLNRTTEKIRSQMH